MQAQWVIRQEVPFLSVEPRDVCVPGSHADQVRPSLLCFLKHSVIPSQVPTPARARWGALLCQPHGEGAWPAAVPGALMSQLSGF